MDSVKSKKVKASGPKTPKSEKKADKSLKKTPIVDTPRPILSAKKQNGIKAAGKPTPNKGQNTPSAKKTPKSEPKKKSKAPVKVEEDDDDDDDEEDDDDSEIELNPEILKSLADASDDDDDEEDDDDDMDDDDDEEDDDEEDDDDDDDDEEDDDDESLDEEELKKLIQSLKSKTDKKPKGAKKPEESSEKKPKEKPAPKGKAAPKESTVKKAEKKDQTETMDQNYLKSMSERDSRTLFIKDLPESVKEEDILKLSSDIKSVRIRKRPRKTNSSSICYAFLEFEDESTTEKNFKLLSKATIGGTQLTVDYTGEKSQNKPKSQKVLKELDPTKLYITGFPSTTTEIELKQLFTKADAVVLPMRKGVKKPLGFAFARFSSEEVCSQTMKEMDGKMLKDSRLIVTFAKLTDRTPKEKGTKRKTKETPGKAKKAKLEKKEEVEEEEEDDEEDEDMEDDDEEDDDDDDDDEEEDDDDDDDE